MLTVEIIITNLLCRLVCAAAWRHLFEPSVTNPGSISRPTWSDIHLRFITQHLVLVTRPGFFLPGATQDWSKDNKPQLKTKKKTPNENGQNLTFSWVLQFPPPSFLARRHQAVIIGFLQVLFFPAGQESVLLRMTQTLPLRAVLCTAGGRVSGNPILDFPLLLFWEAGIRHPVSDPAHVPIEDLCHRHSVAVAYTRTVFKRATALNLLKGKGEVEMLTSWWSIILKDSYSCML